MKEPRDISGIYFFHTMPDGSREPLSFEDLPTDQQQRIVQEMPKVKLESLALSLAETLRRVCDEFNIIAKDK